MDRICKGCKKLISTSSFSKIKELTKCSFHYVDVCNFCFSEKDIDFELERRQLDIYNKDSYRIFKDIVIPKLFLQKKMMYNENK